MAKPVGDGKIDRTRLTQALLRDRGPDLLIVGGLGSATYDLMAEGPSPRNFCLWGAMGLAATIGLGIALAQPEKRVLILTGDGEMLMGMGSLATIADQAPRNLGILVMDNGLYAETGHQKTATAGLADLAKVAEGAGFKSAMTIASAGEFDAARDMLLGGEGPVMVVAKVADQSYGPPAVPETRDGNMQVNRFRVDLLGEYDAMIRID